MWVLKTTTSTYLTWSPNGQTKLWGLIHQELRITYKHLPGPMVHIGAIVGMVMCRRCLAPCLKRLGPFSRTVEEELSRQPLRYHVQAAVMGAGAGIAAAFNAPLAGTVFVVEEAASFFSKKWLWLATSDFNVFFLQCSHTHRHIHTDGQTNRRTDRQTDRQRQI